MKNNDFSIENIHRVAKRQFEMILVTSCPVCNKETKMTGDPIYYYCKYCDRDWNLAELAWNEKQSNLDKWLKERENK